MILLSRLIIDPPYRKAILRGLWHLTKTSRFARWWLLAGLLEPILVFILFHYGIMKTTGWIGVSNFVCWPFNIGFAWFNFAIHLKFQKQRLGMRYFWLGDYWIVPTFASKDPDYEKFIESYEANSFRPTFWGGIASAYTTYLNFIEPEIATIWCLLHSGDLLESRDIPQGSEFD